MDNYLVFVIILMEKKMENTKYIILMNNYIIFLIMLMENKMENIRNIQKIVY